MRKYLLCVVFLSPFKLKKEVYRFTEIYVFCYWFCQDINSYPVSQANLNCFNFWNELCQSRFKVYFR